jgi:NDP-sugar pyrophosphorylase family protein
MITVEKKFAHKIEKYLKSQFINQDPLANIDLVVFSEEEEPVVVLQMLQGRLNSDFIVIEGNSLCDVPLDEILDTHMLSDASVTTLIKEFDMVKGGEGAKLAEVGSEDVFGITSYTPEQIRLGVHDQFQNHRVVLKTNKQDAKHGTVNVKNSLLKK